MRLSLTPLLLMLALPTAFSAPALQPDPDNLVTLQVSRAQDLPMNACDVGIFLQHRIAARLAPGADTELQVPAGEVTLSAAVVGSDLCLQGNRQIRTQSTVIQAGETRRYRVEVDDGGVFLAPAD